MKNCVTVFSYKSNRSPKDVSLSANSFSNTLSLTHSEMGSENFLVDFLFDLPSAFNFRNIFSGLLKQNVELAKGVSLAELRVCNSVH